MHWYLHHRRRKTQIRRELHKHAMHHVSLGARMVARGQLLTNKAVTPDVAFKRNPRGFGQYEQHDGPCLS
ncbi:hypothetical protein DB347_17640 [Opitutaceae bacterium EW11]|nr:hypothetical protein DB347_17640 [Opitutaceae bacterium EW11]